MRLADNYPAMDPESCDAIGLAGDCGSSCPIFMMGRCEYADEGSDMAVAMTFILDRLTEIPVTTLQRSFYCQGIRGGMDGQTMLNTFKKHGHFDYSSLPDNGATSLTKARNEGNVHFVRMPDPDHRNTGYTGKSTNWLLEEMLSLARMENASFGMPTDSVKRVHKHLEHDDHTTVQITDFVKEVTKLWRTSWVLPLIEELMIRFELHANYDDNVRGASKAKREAAQARADCQADQRAAKEYKIIADHQEKTIGELKAEINMLTTRLAQLRDELPTEVRAGGRAMQL